MLNLDRIRWKNLLATGNYFLEVAFGEHKKTLVVGPNGAGKTTLIEALCLCLYNRPFRKVNRAKLVNSITNKGLLIETEFSLPNHKFLVRRGIKPNIFEIFKDGVLVEPPADLRDYQTWLETHVLHMNFRTFCQVVILGSRNYVPFMQLAAAERRSVVENLLDIGVFSIMNTLLKARLQDSQKEIIKADSDMREVEAQLELNKRRLEDARKDYESLIQNRLEVIEELEENFNGLKLLGEATNLDIQKHKKMLVAYDTEAHEEAIGRDRVEDTKQLSDIKELEFFKTHATCPTCLQTISEDFRHNRIEELRTIVFNNDFEARRKLNEFEKIRSDNQIIESIISNFEQDLKKIVAQAKENRWHLEGVQKEVLTMRAKLETKVDDITAELEAKWEEKRAARAEILNRAQVLAQASNLLRDGGVKARVVRKFIPWLNETINKYLEALDLFMVFDMDEEFNEKIYSRGRDDFTYDNLSEGEKLRLDLALLWAWRELGRSRASASVNLLVLDEVLDSSMDAEGAEDFMRILDSMSDNENVVVISHRGESLSDKFTRTLRFDKKLNFSQLEEVS